MDIDIEKTVTVGAAVLATAGGMITAAATFVWKFLKAGIAESETRVMDRINVETAKVAALDKDMGMKFTDVDDELKHQREAAERSRTRIHERLDGLTSTAATKEDLRGLRDDIREMLRMRPPAA